MPESPGLLPLAPSVHRPEELALSPVPSSFRDPSGQVMFDGTNYLRLVHQAYRSHYDHLINSGLCARLVEEKLLVPHEEMPVPRELDAYKLLHPKQVPFISYPYEWCFSQWREAGQVTLRIQELAVEHGMSLKDASAFNIQFLDGTPVLIDTLSFELLDEPRPWVAYGQFCRHFLAPLALMSYRDPRLGRLLQTHLDGVPLDLASALLPRRTRWRLWLRVHLHWHAASEGKFKDATKADAGRKSYSLNSLRGLVASLQGAIERLAPPHAVEDWTSYYGGSVTGGNYVAHKEKTVRAWLTDLRPGMVWDLGANTGLFSRIATSLGASTVAFDSDPGCVESIYCAARQSGEIKLLPLVLDLANPTPALGWDNTERLAFKQRSQPDVVLALALAHHLALANNVPPDRIAAFFAGFSPRLIIEFVPKTDPNAQKLLRIRKDIFPGYTQDGFETAFARFFVIEEKEPMANSERVLYRMTRRLGP